MLARIYQPPKNAMQSGKANTHFWLLEYESEAGRAIDPLMGWTSTTDMRASELRMRFDTKDLAVAYAERHGIPYEVVEPKPVVRQLKTYSDNFRYDRVR